MSVGDGRIPSDPIGIGRDPDRFRWDPMGSIKFLKYKKKTRRYPELKQNYTMTNQTKSCQNNSNLISYLCYTNQTMTKPLKNVPFFFVILRFWKLWRLMEVGFVEVGVGVGGGRRRWRGRRRIWWGWRRIWWCWRRNWWERRIWCGEKVRESERVRMKEMERDGDEVYFELRVFLSKIGTKVQFWIFFN